jgi:hypothetical protein
MSTARHGGLNAAFRTPFRALAATRAFQMEFYRTEEALARTSAGWLVEFFEILFAGKSNFQ